MELHLTPEQEAYLHQVAEDEGKTAEQLVVAAISGRFAGDRLFRQAVQRGLDQADSRHFIEEDEMNIRVQKMILS